MSDKIVTKPQFETSDSIDRFPMEGVEVWVNPKNKFLVFQLHYSANPIKNEPSYRDSIKSSMPRAQYLQEYELQWDSFSGLPVYQDFVERVHGSKERLQPESGLPLLRGWDFGLTPACVVAQLQDDRLVVLWEKTSQNMGIKRFADIALSEIKQLFPEWADPQRDWIDFADPAGAQRKDTDEGTCFQILEGSPSRGGFGLRIRPGAIAFEGRRSSVEHFLLKHTKEGPAFQIDMERCPVLVRGFKGGYRYSEHAAEIEPMKLRPLKDEHSHPHDALQMITSSIVHRNERKGKKTIRRPGYSWSGATPKVGVIIE